ncbi:MAG TPA: hypothetical protein VE175_05700 [Woeseiaceae bacterium]|nr:hypothetical protein [Woeseiaceae bacterium]
MLKRSGICSHPGCTCELESRSVSIGDRSYCSGDCAEGIGCDHEACACGRATKEPGVGALIEDAVRHLHGKS